jgi:hypothetical protein
MVCGAIEERREEGKQHSTLLAVLHNPIRKLNYIMQDAKIYFINFIRSGK